MMLVKNGVFLCAEPGPFLNSQTYYSPHYSTGCKRLKFRCNLLKMHLGKSEWKIQTTQTIFHQTFRCTTEPLTHATTTPAQRPIAGLHPWEPDPLGACTCHTSLSCMHWAALPPLMHQHQFAVMFYSQSVQQQEIGTPWSGGWAYFPNRPPLKSHRPRQLPSCPPAV